MQIKPGNLFQAVITYDTFHRKEETGQNEKELQQRVERKMHEINFDYEKMHADIENSLSAFMSLAK